MNFDRPNIAWVPAISNKDAAEANEDQKAYTQGKVEDHKVRQEILVAKGHRIAAEKKAHHLTKIDQMLSAVTHQQKVAKRIIKWLSGSKITTGYLGKVIKVIDSTKAGKEHKTLALLIKYMKGERKL